MYYCRSLLKLLEQEEECIAQSLSGDWLDLYRKCLIHEKKQVEIAIHSLRLLD